MRNTLEQIDEITEQQMFYNIHQIHHILNALIGGQVVDGTEIDTDKFIEYKLSLVKLEELKSK